MGGSIVCRKGLLTDLKRSRSRLLPEKPRSRNLEEMGVPASSGPQATGGRKPFQRAVRRGPAAIGCAACEIMTGSTAGFDNVLGNAGEAFPKPGKSVSSITNSIKAHKMASKTAQTIPPPEAICDDAVHPAIGIKKYKVTPFVPMRDLQNRQIVEWMNFVY